MERVEDSRIIGITYTAGTPEDATAVANAYAEAYVDSFERRSREAMDRRAEFLKSRVAEVERLAASSYREARQIRSSDGPELWGFEDLDARTAWLTQARSEIEDAEAAVSARLSLLQNTDDLEARKVAAFQVEGGPELVTAYEEASEKLEQLRQRGAAQYLIAQLEVSVESLQGEMDRLIARARSSLEQERKILLARSDSINGDFEQALSQSSRRNWSEVLIAEHQAGVFQNIYADHLRELEVVYGRAGVVPLSVVARARPGADPSWPSNKLVLMLAVASWPDRRGGGRDAARVAGELRRSCASRASPGVTSLGDEFQPRFVTASTRPGCRPGWASGSSPCFLLFPGAHIEFRTA